MALKDRDAKERPESIKLLNEVIDQRIEGSNLLKEDAKTMAIQNSGRNLRQLIKLVNLAAESAYTYEAKKIGEEKIRVAKERIERDLSSLVMPKAQFLKYIQTHKKIDNEDDDHQEMLAEATRSGLMFAYFNGITWYDINPLIAKAINEYLRDA